MGGEPEEIKERIVNAIVNATRPKYSIWHANKWHWHIEDIDLKGPANLAIYVIHIIWTRYGGLFNKPKEWRHYIIRVRAKDATVISVKEMDICPFCDELISVNATRCPYCRSNLGNDACGDWEVDEDDSEEDDWEEGDEDEEEDEDGDEEIYIFDAPQGWSSKRQRVYGGLDEEFIKRYTKKE
ncbi:hypothetical protein SDD30_15980 [Moorella naiadis]|uniref:hypothetical protein n=1 Tax=Moorella naiadis (nom. illeg.) TaxID=3093670 RepID=UPI003D9C97DB